MSAHDRGAPVDVVATGSTHDDLHSPQDGIALCLSGGGYRATLFHAGALWRLNELGYLPKLARISSVSGGSIAAGVLGLKWHRLRFDSNGVGTEFETEIVSPLLKLASRTIDAGAIVEGLLLPGTISDKVVNAYQAHLFGAATLQDLPDGPPHFVINATSVQTGALFRFSKPYLADYRRGTIPNPKTPLAVAVAASSAFPPVLSPLTLHFDSTEWAPPSGLPSEDLRDEPYLTEVVLTDGGVYDNLGLETAWKKYTTILVSDGGGKPEPEKAPHADWARHSLRIIDLIDDQVRSLRTRQVIGSFQAGDRTGTYWGVRSDINSYGIAGQLPCPLDRTRALAHTPTRLAALDSTVQEQLINWGYAICDAAMRKHVVPGAPAPSGFPYPVNRV